MLDYAKLGLRSMGVAPRTAKPSPSPATGFTMPTTIWDKMQRIQASAESLNSDVRVHVNREAFKAAWDSWLAGWKTFFDKYQGIVNRLGSWTHTDELNKQTDAYGEDLVHWYDGYSREQQPDGTPVPPPSSQPPKLPPPRTEESSGFSVPWWLWMLGGVAVVGIGYYAYKQVKELQAKKEAIETRVLPAVFGATMGPTLGPAMAQAAVARDPMALSTYAYAPGANHMHPVSYDGTVLPMRAFPYGPR